MNKVNTILGQFQLLPHKTESLFIVIPSLHKNKIAPNKPQYNQSSTLLKCVKSL